MRLEHVLIPTLPRLAWAAELRKGQETILVRHGPWVEAREDCFFEGAWDGPFEHRGFDAALTFLGSGARLAGSGIVFASPTHTFERLHSIMSGDALFVSNSLAFLLALSGERLDPSHPHYYLDFLDHFRSGIHVKAKRLRLAGSRFVELHDCCNLEVRPDLSMSRREKPLGSPPKDYASYVVYLSQTTKALFANAGDARRKWRYRPVTSLSQGYDTTAVSAIAARAGCREAVTFRRSNGASGYEDDSGRSIAQYLNLEITEYERTDYDRLPERLDHEFYIEPGGIDRSLAVMEQQLSGALLLTGRFGERLWNRELGIRWGLPGDTGNPDFLARTGFKLGGCALGEFRMRVGFIHFPLPCSGGLHAPAIRAITESSEMKPWSVGGGYDRPIARRIAEEASVPGSLFGQSKKGGPQRSGRQGRNWIRRVIYSLWVASYWPPLRILIQRVAGNRLNPMWRRGSFEVQHGMERVTQRYAPALSESARAHRSVSSPAG